MTLCHWIEKMADRPSELVAIKYRKKVWKELTWSEYKAQVDAVSSALVSFGLKPQDKVAIFSSTRFEWAVADLGILGCQGITIPIYHTLTEEELVFVLEHSKPKIIFIENSSLLRLFRRVAGKVPSIEQVIVFDQPGEIDSDLHTFPDLLKNGNHELAKNRPEIRNRRSTTQLSTPATILYTSGTTGRPRGVLLTHAQIVSEVTEAFPLCGVRTSDVSLSFLPYSHILGRIEMWGHLYIGFTLAFAESIERVKNNLEKIKPTILVAVPRIFEKIYGAILAKVESGQQRKKIFNWALQIGKQISDLKIERRPIPLTNFFRS
jgi:long-chain acyl-CoA synthetase